MGTETETEKKPSIEEPDEIDNDPDFNEQLIDKSHEVYKETNPGLYEVLKKYRNHNTGK